MQTDCFDDSFYSAFVRMLTNSKQQLIVAAARHDLTIMQALTLLHMRSETLTMGDFSKLFACDAGNITGIIDGLEQKMLVSRQPHPDDKRIKIIQLEAAGATLQTALLHDLASNGNVAFGALDSDERCAFARLIKKIAG